VAFKFNCRARWGLRTRCASSRSRSRLSNARRSRCVSPAPQGLQDGGARCSSTWWWRACRRSSRWGGSPTRS